MKQDDIGLIKRLQKPSGKVDVVLDTDTFNEIDDQFALALLIKSTEKLNLKGVYAAPFFNQNSISPADGMEKSYNEIFKILKLMKREDLNSLVQKGSRAYLKSETEPVDSPAAKALCRLAMQYSTERPLYIVAIGAITNIASAILMAPEIINRIVIVWLGGHAHHWPLTKIRSWPPGEFNMSQDVAAARVVFGSGAALVHLPCMGVVSSFSVSGAELDYWLCGKNELCNYLVDYTTESAIKDGGLPAWTRVIWDVTAVAWLLDGGFMDDCLVPSPIPEYDNHYAFDSTRHFIRYVYHIHRDELFGELVKKLTG